MGLVGTYLSPLYAPVMGAQRRNDLPPPLGGTYFVDIDKLIIKFLWKGKRPKIASPTLRKKEKVED